MRARLLRPAGTLTGALALGLCGLAGVAEGANGTGIDAMENVFGATNVNAITGHGGLTAGISADGDLTVLAWPNPSTVDQLAYISSNAVDARDRPRFGAEEGAGLFLGLLVDGALTWLRDWEVVQDYGPSAASAVHTRFRNDALGLTVTLVDGIHPTVDVLTRAVTVTADGAPPTLSLVTYANLSPLPPNAYIPALPVADWAMDGRNDYAAVWDAASGSVVHFHPDDERVHDTLVDLVLAPSVDWGAVGDQLALGTPDASAMTELLGALRTEDDAGAWALLTTVPPPAEHQVGQDATDLCGTVDELADNIAALPDRFPGFNLPLSPEVLDNLRCGDGDPIHVDEGWVHVGADAWGDLADGALEGSDLAAGEVNEALITPLAFDGQTATGRVVLALGSTWSGAEAARQEGVDGAVHDAADAAVVGWLGGLRLPGPDGSEIQAVARRSLINVRVGTDRLTGAIVASIARQPPYALDWPRDGAFFNVMLDASGQSELVTRRSALYADWQRLAPLEPDPLMDPPPPVDPRTGLAEEYPAFAWEMNGYPDGTAGGFIRFEIDTTALAVWTIVAHAGWVEDPEGYLAEHWDVVRRATGLLMDWRDEATGLHAPAQEDDQANHTQTLHGAVTVFAALEIASRAARLLGEDATAAAWEARAGELRDAMLTHFWSDEELRFVQEDTGRVPFQASGEEPTGPAAWVLWPARLLPEDDQRMARQTEVAGEVVRSMIELDGVGGLYFMKSTVSQAMRGALGLDSPLLGALASDHPTEGTRHFGEVTVVGDGPDGPAALQRTATPHLWEGSLFALTAYAAEDPGALLAYEDVLPESRVPAATVPVPDALLPPGDDEGGCGCATNSTGAGGLAILLAVGAFIARRRLP